MIQLSKRLKGVADLVSSGHCVADVGCDHGYVSIYLVQHKRAEHVIAMDVNQGPLDRAGWNVKRAGLDAYIETRLSDGLKALFGGEAETVICAGMGGRLMVRILSQGDVCQKGIRELVLQPQSEIALVRRYLYEHGFVICEENMVLDDGKYYQMLRALRQPDDEQTAAWKDGGLSDAEAHYGPCLLRRQDPVLRQFLLLERAKYRKLYIDVLNENPEKSGALQKKCLLIEEALAGYTNEV